jgi:TonB-dependent SusC/RagA subfamily outer membrane receptor
MKTLTSAVKLFFFSCLVCISADSFAQGLPQGTYRNIYEMLRNVPGLDVQSANGKGGTITVRGVSSLTRQGQPLFVVNGTIYNGDIGSLNVQDVEGISVLKDGASTSAYGAQGAFGVIIITLKKGATLSSTASVESHTESAYTYFIDKKIPLKVFDMNDAVMIEGVIQKQKGDSLVFTKKRKDIMIAISSIKRVEMIPQQ